MSIRKAFGPPWPYHSNLVLIDPQRGQLAPFGVPGDHRMTKQPNDIAPELIVLGRDEQGKPRAARFPVSQADLVAKAAAAMNLTVCKADGAALAELANKLPTGRLYATGQGFVPPVGRNLYGKIVEQSKLAGQPPISRPPTSLHRGCRQRGTTSPSATW